MKSLWLLGAIDLRVEHQRFQVGQTHRLEHTRPNTRLRPAIETLIDRIPLAESLRQIADTT
jgi:hypothetical protein